MHTQSQQILAYLREGKSITPLEALNLFGCFRLGARCFDLRKQGHNIQSEIVHEKGKHFAKYWLSDEPEKTELEQAVSDNNLAQETIINRKAFEKNGQFAFIG